MIGTNFNEKWTSNTILEQNTRYSVLIALKQANWQTFLSRNFKTCYIVVSNVMIRNLARSTMITLLVYKKQQNVTILKLSGDFITDSTD